MRDCAVIDAIPSKYYMVHPWGVEPQSMEPESIILSIELWVHPDESLLMAFSGAKVINFSELWCYRR